jgi:hypothetical protein
MVRPVEVEAGAGLVEHSDTAVIDPSDSSLLPLIDHWFLRPCHIGKNFIQSL